MTGFSGRGVVARLLMGDRLILETPAGDLSADRQAAVPTFRPSVHSHGVRGLRGMENARRGRRSPRSGLPCTHMGPAVSAGFCLTGFPAARAYRSQDFQDWSFILSIL